MGTLFGKSFNEKNVQIFGRISAISFIIWQNFVNVWQNTPCAIWSFCSGLLTALVLSNSVARLC